MHYCFMALALSQQNDYIRILEESIVMFYLLILRIEFISEKFVC